MKRLTLKTVNKAIQTKFPNVELVKGNGYFYIVGMQDTPMALTVAELYETSIYTYQLNDLPIERWVREVELLLNQDMR